MVAEHATPCSSPQTQSEAAELCELTQQHLPELLGSLFYLSALSLICTVLGSAESTDEDGE